MAKREINRQVGFNEDAVKEIETPEAALPAEKQARPAAVKPLDVTVTMKSPGTFVVRVWSGAVLFAGKGKMNKIPIVPGKPVTIRITQ